MPRHSKHPGMALRALGLKTPLPLTVLVALLLAGLALPLVAENPPEKAAVLKTPEEVGLARPAAGSLPATLHGVQVFLDPRTGQVRAPNPEEAARLSAVMQRLVAGAAKRTGQAQPVVGPDGMMKLELDPALFSHVVARKKADGTVALDCADDAATLRSLLETNSPAPSEARTAAEEE